MAQSQGQLTARVAAGILVTRVLGFVRERVFAHYFGNSATADAFRAALRIPNAIRNLLGEGTLSASFIPVYAGMLERGETDEARRLAGAVASWLMLLTALTAVAGILLAPLVTDIVAPGFDGRTRDLTVRLVEIMFPMFGIIILSAWCLGVLNTHRRFFLSYAAPSMWNIAQIATLLGLGGVLTGARLAVALAVGAVVGSVLQLLVQLPMTLRLVRGFTGSLSLEVAGVRPVVRAWVPVVFGAGVVQLSSIIDTQLGSWLGAGAVAVLGYAQLLAILPISLFGVSVAAAALPELSRDAAGADSEKLRARLADGARRLAFFVLPSAFAYVVLGRVIVSTLFETGQFGRTDSEVAAGVLAAYAIGLLGQASVKLFASGHYALGDTRTPVRIAALSVALSAAVGAFSMRYLGAAGIALGAAAGSYVNVGLLVVRLERRVGTIIGAAARRELVAVLLGAVAAGLVAATVARTLAAQPTWIACTLGLVGFGTAYGVVTLAAGHPDARRLVTALRR
ncbi:MAG TPA: murein biosynthesis integral membrane protein MurJ [Gemmatimonadales bacterium]